MAAIEEIYGYEKVLKGILHSLEKSSFPDPDRALIEKFSRYLFAQGLSYGRIIKYTIEARKVTETLGKPLLEVVKDDIIELVQKIERKNDYTEYTKHDYKLTIKKLFRFIEGTEDYPEKVRWIRLTTKKAGHKLPEELLTEEEVKRLAESARTPRDRALVLVLYESGCRIGEMLSLKIKNVQFDDYGAVLMVDGKTGMRRVRIIASASALAAWISIHPLRSNTDSPLWVSLGTNSRDLPLKHRTACDLLKKLARIAHVNKRIYPHLFRHSRATRLANHLTEAQLKQHFGWVQGSDMASTYVHLSGRDVDRALLKLNGIGISDEDEKESFSSPVCPRCKGRNSPDSKFCAQCGLCLDVKTAIAVDEAREKVDRLMNKLVKRPEVLEQMLKVVENIKD